MINMRPSNRIAARRVVPCRCRHQRGLTLVELMVAMVISLIIMVGVGTLYVSTKRNYLVENAFSRLQENARYATNYLTTVVRNAGYVGCSSGGLALSPTSMISKLNQSTSLLYNFATGIEGYEFLGTGPGQTYPSTQPTAYPTAPDTNTGDWNGPNGTVLPTLLTGTNLLMPGSDVLIVRSANKKNVTVSSNNNSSQVFVNHTTTKAGACSGGGTAYSGICPGDILVISDCQKSVAFQATNVQVTGGCPAQNPNCVNIAHSRGTYTPGNSVSSWGGATLPSNMSFGPGSEVMGISTQVFFVGLPQSGPNKGIPALYLKDGQAAPQELVPGVENMQVLYGVDTNNNKVANKYVTANNVPNGFENVVSARISLMLMTSPLNNHPLVTKLYPMDGVWTGALQSAVQVYPVKNRRMRKVITFTVKLRNRSVKLQL